MPTYEYRCTACKHEFEKFQRMSDEPVADCPECGKPAERRLSAGAGLLFKGSGFYITDYRSDSYKKAAGTEGGSGKAGSEKTDGKKAGGEKAGGEKAASDKSSSSSKSESKSSSKDG